MAKHRLTDINKPAVVVVGYDGMIWRMGDYGREYVGGGCREVEHGDYDH